MTNNSENSRPDTTSRTEGRGIFQIILADLSSAKLAASAGSLIVLACILGTLLPQGADVQRFLQAKPQYAGSMKFLDSIKLTNVFESWWFIFLLVFFSSNVTACLVRRITSLIKVGRINVSGLGFLLTHVSILLILAGAVIRIAFGQRGYMDIRQGETSAHFMTPAGPVKMPFDVDLVKFELEYYDEKAEVNPEANAPDTLSIDWPDHDIQTQLVVEVGVSVSLHPNKGAQTESNTVLVTVSRYVPDFAMDMTTREVSTRSEDPNNPAIQVSVETEDLHLNKWLFGNHPDFDMLHSPADKNASGNLTLRYHSAEGERLGKSRNRSQHIRSFKSTLKLLEDGKVSREKTIEVNSPLSYGGYTLYQSGYDPNDLTRSTIEVVRDPGVPVVYAGFLCMIGGLILLLGFKPAARNKSAEAGTSIIEGQLP